MIAPPMFNDRPVNMFDQDIQTLFAVPLMTAIGWWQVVMAALKGALPHPGRPSRRGLFEAGDEPWLLT